MRVQMVHNEHLFDLFSSFHQEPTFLEMFASTILAKWSFIFDGTIAYSMTIIVASKADNLLRTFFRMMLG